MKLLNQYPWLRSWETLLFVILCGTVVMNMQFSEFYFDLDNLANIFHLSIEKAFVVLIMAFVIINGEIDLSVASVMGLSATVLSHQFENGQSFEVAILYALLVGVGCGLINGLLIAYLRIPSLVVTLAGLIAYRGAARILLEDRSVGSFPIWFTDFAQKEFLGPFEATTYLFFVLFAIFLFVLQFTTFGRYIYVIGNNREAAEYAGLRVRQVKTTIFVLSALMAAFAGLMYAARIGNVRANAAEGFELDIITIVLLGGVSIFGGTGTMVGVSISLFVVLNIRNGMSLKNMDGTTQASVVGVLLILSVLVPNLLTIAQNFLSQYKFANKNTLSLESKEVLENTETA